VLGVNLPDMKCQGCKVGLLAIGAILKNKFVADIGKTIIAEKLCPLVVMNATICKNGTETMASPLIDAFTNAILDPEYFCENTVILCHDGDYQMYHAEEFVNRQYKSKPLAIKNNDFLNQLYFKIANQKNRP